MASDDVLFSMIAERRRALADVLDGLSDQQARTPSLCDGWTVHHVAAHLTMGLRLSIPKVAVRMVLALGNFNKVADAYAKETAAKEPLASLAATIRDRAEHRFTPPGVGAIAPLTDITAHGLDIRTPLGIASDQPLEQLREVLEFLTSRTAGRGGVGPRVPLSELRIEATDVDLASGSGLLVRGPASSLVLALTGRRGGLDALDGPGADRLRTV